MQRARPHLRLTGGGTPQLAVPPSSEQHLAPTSRWAVDVCTTLICSSHVEAM
jgi:hypothetical protein